MGNNLKTERFRRVASLRVQRILDAMDNLAKCSNRGNYEYSDDDVRKMMSAIRSRVKNLEHVFSEQSGSKNDKFNF